MYFSKLLFNKSIVTLSLSKYIQFCLQLNQTTDLKSYCEEIIAETHSASIQFYLIIIQLLFELKYNVVYRKTTYCNNIIVAYITIILLSIV